MSEIRSDIPSFKQLSEFADKIFTWHNPDAKELTATIWELLNEFNLEGGLEEAGFRKTMSGGQPGYFRDPHRS